MAVIAERLVTRPVLWGILAVWLALLVVFAPPGTKLAGVTNDDYVLPGGSQTARLQHVLHERFPGGDQRLALLVYRREGGLTAADRGRILADARAAAKLPEVGRPVPPFTPSSPAGLVSSNGDVALTAVPLDAGEVFQVRTVIEDLRAIGGADGDLEMHVTGFPALIADVNSAIKEADLKLLAVTVVLVLLLLVAVYRSPMLAILPLLVVGLAYSVTAGVVYLLNQHAGLPVDSTATSLLLVLMFGAGTDYCLLIVARYRSALRTHERPRDAMATTLTEAGPAIIASGATVITALVVMLAAVFGLNRTLGPVNAIGVAIVLLASLTLLPAALVWLGRRAFWPNTGSVAYGGRDEPEGGSAGGFWHRLAAWVRRHRTAALTTSVAALCVAALGIGLHDDAMSPAEQFRSPTDGTRGYEVVRSAFPPGTLAPTTVLVDRPQGVLRPGDLTAVADKMSAIDGVVAVTDTGRRSTDRRAATLSAVFEDDPFGDPALARVADMRDAARSVDPALHVLVGQGSGERVDYLAGARRDLRVVAPIVLAVVFLTLVLLLRAVVSPLYLLATVVLSFLATMGAALVIFDVVLGRDAIDPALPLVVFIFLVALGSDYNIFLMSRVREEAVAHGTAEGMFRGLVATGPVITSAGLVLAGTFAVLIVLPVYALVEIGLAVALGVLLDTLVVRSVCVPAITWLVGERSWWPSRIGAPERALVTGEIPALSVPPGGTRVAQGPPPQPGGGSFVVRIGRADSDGRVIPLDRSLVIGRDPSSGVPLADDQLVSAQHARLTPTVDGLLVEDLGSKNGTYVDGVPLDGPLVARPGSRIGVGGTSMSVERKTSRTLLLAFLSGKETGRVLEVSHPIVIGRDSGLDVALVDDERVSRQHARLRPGANGIEVEDLGSLNGTFVNDVRVEQPMLAWIGDRVAVGGTTMEIRARSAMSYALQVVDGPLAGQSLRIGEAIELGRGPTSSFVLEGDDLASRLHARVSPAEDGVVVEDLQSQNGTTVNGKDVTEPTIARPGALITMGSTTFKVVRAEDVEARPTTVRSGPGRDADSSS